MLLPYWEPTNISSFQCAEWIFKVLNIDYGGLCIHKIFVKIIIYPGFQWIFRNYAPEYSLCLCSVIPQNFLWQCGLYPWQFAVREFVLLQQHDIIERASKHRGRKDRFLQHRYRNRQTTCCYCTTSAHKYQESIQGKHLRVRQLNTNICL